MLSAIAARKAAQAARQSQDNSLTSSVEPTPPPASSSDDTPPPAKQSTKRKSSSQTPRPAKKKKKEQKREQKKDRQPRYFASEDVLSQEDVILVDSDQEDLLSDAEDAPAAAGVARAWSPSIPVNDSSDEEEEEGGTAASVLPPPYPMSISPRKPVLQDDPPILSTFEPRTNDNIIRLDPLEVEAFGVPVSSDAALVSLEPEDTICLLGTYALTVLRGSVKITGVMLSASKTEHKVFAPRSAPLPVLEAVSSDATVVDEATLPSSFRHLLGTDSTLLLLREFRTGVEGLGQVCKPFAGVFAPSRFGKAAVIPGLGLSGMHMLQYQPRDVQAFELPFTWISALSLKNLDTGSPWVHLVKGPKNSGKSTFARTLVNALLSRYQRVAYLDCDLGQSEFGPGGMVSLNVIDRPVFGPAFTHPTLPLRAHFIGSTSPRSSPSHYLESIQSLIEYYQTDVKTPAVMPTDDTDTRVWESIPLVINTMGWNKGLGADLTKKIEGMMEVTHVYEFDAPIPQDSSWAPAPPPMFTHVDEGPRSSAKVFKLAPAPTSILSTNWSAADHRAISLLSYFHATFPKPVPHDELQPLTATSWTTTLPLCARPPYEVNFRAAMDRLILTGAGAEDVVPGEVWRVLNGAVVGLVNCEPGTCDQDGMPTAFPYIQGSSPPAPSTSHCIGLGLIRSVSPPSSSEAEACIHLLAPLPPRLLGQGRVFVKGEMELPIWGMLDYRAEDGSIAGMEKGRVPYLQWGKGEGVGAEKRRVRRNLMRRGQT